MKKDGWKWEREQNEAFREVKMRVMASPVLKAPQEDKPWRIEADSSDFTTGAILSQLSGDNNKWHPVAFLSKSLTAVERNYKTHDKEMLAIIRALEEW